ncbi:MAG: hemolysin family protein [Candidatus Zixiibacteriota bacterium]
MSEFFFGFVILFCLSTGYVVSLYALAFYLDPEEAQKKIPPHNRVQRRILEHLSEDARAFRQLAIVYKSFVLIVCSASVIHLFRQLEVEVVYGVSSVVGLALVWSLYLFIVEYLPRRISRNVVAEGRLRHFWAITLVYLVFFPVVRMYRHRGARARDDQEAQEVDREEIVGRAIETLADEAGIGESIVEQEEKEMIGQIFRLDDTTVREIMVPRMDVVAISKDMAFREIRSLVQKDGHSRYPVFDGSIEKIIGLIYVKDLFNNMPEPGEEFTISKFLRPVFLVPETKIIGDLLREFRNRRQHIAVVVDEFGGVAGVVTLEDIIEVIVGDIQDEHDREEDNVSRLSDGTFRVNASVGLDEMQEFLATEYDGDDYDTVGGLLYSLVGSVPTKGQKIRWHDIEFEIDRLQGQRIHFVKVRKLIQSDTARQ